MNTLPVTVICGFAGAGKTTLLQHLVASRPDLRIAVMINSAQPEASPAEAEKADARLGAAAVIRFSGGCICCSQREDLLNELVQLVELVQTNSCDYLLIEADAAADPLAITEVFTAVDDLGQSLSEIVPLDTLVTVVDATSFLSDFQSVDELGDRGLGGEEDADRDVSQLLADQVELANVLVVNKLEDVAPAEREPLLSLLRALNPRAVLLETPANQVAPAAVMHTGLFQEDLADDLQVPETSPDSPSAAEDLCTIAYRARRPFHPQRLFDFWMDDALTENILRSRGFIWLATRHAIAGYWSQAGRVVSAQPAGLWWAESPREEWPLEDEQMIAEIESVWDPAWGDRRQELKILVQAADATAVCDALNACLLTEAEFAGGPDTWTALPDPFDEWVSHDHDHDCGHDHDHDHDCSRDHDHG